MFRRHQHHLPSSDHRTGQIFLVGDSIHSGDAPFACLHDNTAGIDRISYEETLCHVFSVYPWLIFGDGVDGTAIGVGYTHGSEMSVFSVYIFSLSDTEHRRAMQSRVVKLPYLFDPSVISFNYIPGHGFRRHH